MYIIADLEGHRIGRCKGVCRDRSSVGASSAVTSKPRRVHWRWLAISGPLFGKTRQTQVQDSRPWGARILVLGDRATSHDSLAAHLAMPEGQPSLLLTHFFD